MNRRKDARKAVATLIRNNIDTFEVVYDYQTLNFGPLTPVAMVYSDGTALFARTLDGHSDRCHALLIDMWWEWGPGVEDALDDLSQAVLNLFAANQETTDWSNLLVDQDLPNFSRMAYSSTEVNGKVYRREIVRIVVE
ncbi:MAG: hypothetical protein U0350_36365 [Caldilineaceae bacterium]